MSKEKLRDGMVVAEELAFLELAPETTVRVVRAVIYEGSYYRVKESLRSSLQPQDYAVDDLQHVPGELCISIRQGSPEIIEMEGDFRDSEYFRDGVPLEQLTGAQRLISKQEDFVALETQLKAVKRKLGEEQRRSRELNTRLCKTIQELREVKQRKALDSVVPVAVVEDVFAQMSKQYERHMTQVVEGYLRRQEKHGKK